MASADDGMHSETPLSSVLSAIMESPVPMVPLGDLQQVPTAQQQRVPPQTQAEVSAARPEIEERPAHAGLDLRSPLLRGVASTHRWDASQAGPSSYLGGGTAQPRTPSRVPTTATAAAIPMTPRANPTVPLTWESLGRTRSPNRQLQDVVAKSRGDVAPIQDANQMKTDIMRSVREELDAQQTQLAKEIFGARDDTVKLRDSLVRAEQATADVHRQAVSDRPSVHAASERTVQLRNEVATGLAGIEQFRTERDGGVGDAVVRIDSQLRSDLLLSKPPSNATNSVPSLLSLIPDISSGSVLLPILKA